ncbi:helix-turn-helix domain-containing protein [Sporosarcina sp. PTS2304]
MWDFQIAWHSNRDIGRHLERAHQTIANELEPSQLKTGCTPMRILYWL